MPGDSTDALVPKLSIIHRSAMRMHEAMQPRPREVLQMPRYKAVWGTYFYFHKCKLWGTYAVWGLLALSFFETPLWCSNDDIWNSASPQERCKYPESEGQPALLSGLPMLPIGTGLIIESILLIVVLIKIGASARLQSFFSSAGILYFNRTWLVFDYLMIFLGFVDVIYFYMVPSTKIRLAPIVRFGLAASEQKVQDSLFVIYRIFLSIWKPLQPLILIIVLFAWIMALILDDVFVENEGLQANQGYDSFMAAVYTSMVAMMTANLPDAMIPSFLYSRWLIVLWMLFFLLAICIFSQVILAVVYNEYQDIKKAALAQDRRNKDKHLVHVFKLISKAHSAEAASPVIHFEEFQEAVVLLDSFSNDFHIDPDLLTTVYRAIDDDNSGMLSLEEFMEMCDVLQYSFEVKPRVSPIRARLGDSSVGRFLDYLFYFEHEGPICQYVDDTNLDKVVNVCLLVNIVCIVVASVYDLNDWDEPEILRKADLSFVFAYVVDISLKLCFWHWKEYFFFASNRFDFFSTAVLGAASYMTLFNNFPAEILRLLNLLRLVRMIKYLNQFESFRQTVTVVYMMITTCSDVLLLNVVVWYLWSSIGCQLFGGQLYKENPLLSDQSLDYFDSNFEIYNFNDLFLGIITLFFFMITGWVDQVAAAAMALAKEGTVFWFTSRFFMVSFYIASPLIAFNLFIAFSIDVFIVLQEKTQDDDGKKSEVDQNLEEEKTKFAERGLCLHVSQSAELSRSLVYREMFEEDDDGEDD